jgi:hypothetical protein
MSIVTIELTVGFALAFVGYYGLVWTIRGERLGPTPSVYAMLSNPFSLLFSDLTPRGRQLRWWLLLDFALVVILGLGAFFIRMPPHAVP